MAGWIAGAVVGGSLIGAFSSGNAADAQADAANRSSDLQYQQFKESTALQEPWRKAGEQALNKLIPLASEYQPFGMQQFQQDPGYAFRMSEGMKALDRTAAARGGLLSGATLKGAQRYGQELGSQEYQNAFNRYQAERTARLQPLQSLAGVGQTTAQQIAQSGMNMAQNVGETQMSGAAARASGYVGQANALTGGLNTGLNYYQNQNLMNRMFPQTGGMGQSDFAQGYTSANYG